jgi:hypothetical protein
MPQQTHFTSDAVISRRSPLTAPPSLPARRKSSPRLRGWSGRKVHTGQGVRRINSVSSTGTENPLIRGGHSALLVGYPVNVSHRAAIPASTPKVFSTVAGLVRPQCPHRPGRPSNPFGVCGWDGNPLKRVGHSALLVRRPRQHLHPRRRPRQHIEGLLPGCGLVRPQGSHRPGRPPNQFGVCAWDGKSAEMGWAFGAARASSRQCLHPRRHPRQHAEGLLHGCGAGQAASPTPLRSSAESVRCLRLGRKIR